MNCPLVSLSKLSSCVEAHPHVSLCAFHKCELMLYETHCGFRRILDEIDEQNTYMNQLQFSRYITTPSTTTATSGSDLDPPLAPPPPPPPLVITPSRARRQLAARLALHSKQNAEKALSSNGNEPPAEKADSQENLNPFTTEEDDDDDGREDFTIGDIEIAAEGKGILPPATVLTGQQAPLDDLTLDLDGGDEGNNHVGISKSSSNIRANFPSMWPFGQSNRSGHNYEVSAAYREKELEREKARVRMNFSSGNPDTMDQRNCSETKANEIVTQSSDDSESSDDSDDEFTTSAGIAGAKGKGGRRPSTTEAKRRTILEDDDEEEVVHVGRAPAGDDEELIEIQHTEMQGVESGHHVS